MPPLTPLGVTMNNFGNWVSSGPLKTWSSDKECASCRRVIRDSWKNGHTCWGCKKSVHKDTNCYSLWEHPWLLNLDLWEPEKVSNPDRICTGCYDQVKQTVKTMTEMGINPYQDGAKDKYRAYVDSQSQGMTSSGSLWGKFDVQDNAFVVAVKRVMDAVYPGSRSWKIALGGSKSSSNTNLKTREITLPNIWRAKEALGKSSETILDTLTGMAIHEAGHAQFSTLEGSQRLYDQVKRRGYSEQAGQALLNVTEDYFLERKIKDRFPNFANYFRHTYNWTLQGTRAKLEEILKDEHAEDMFGARVAVATWEILVPGELARQKIEPAAKLNDLAQQCHDLLAERFNSGVMETAEKRADVALELYEILKTPELECSKECKQKQKAEGTFDEKCPVHGGNQELMARLAAGDEANREHTKMSLRFQTQQQQVVENVPKPHASYLPVHQKRISRLQPVIQEMRKVLQLRNTQAAGKRTELRSGRINRRSLSRLSTTHTTTVFQQKEPEKYPKVRMGFLVDESGSMQDGYGSNQAFEHARDACTSIVEAASQIRGVKIWSWGYSTAGRYTIRRYASPGSQARHMIEMPIMNGGTPTAMCMEKAAEILVAGAAQDEQIYCFVITDGYSEGDTAGVVATFPQVTFVHVGIGGVTDQGFPYYVGPIQRAAQLPRMMSEAVMQLLMR